MKREKIFSTTVILLSLVSLFNDISSEMLIPILPVYLTTIGFTAFYIGVLEGLAEAVSGLTKAYFGKLSDNFQNRIGFVRWGYSMSAVSKSMMALFTLPIWVFFSRTLDRLGKGVRTGARDALLADESLPEHRGKIFGLNKAMDTTGAVLGVIAAAVYLHFFPGNYRNLFFIAFIPAIVAVSLIWIIKENKKIHTKKKNVPGIIASFSYWKKSSPEYRKLVIGFLLFALFNSSDAFIFLVGKNCRLNDTTILTAYILYNIVFALAALPFGHLADKFGMKFSYLIGTLFFAIAYFIFPNSNSPFIFFIAFLVYGIFAACSDGISKAWISKSCRVDEKATALGFYSGMQSIVILLSNVAAGILWTKTSPLFLFYVSASGAVVVLLYFLFHSPVENVGSSIELTISAKKT